MMSDLISRRTMTSYIRLFAFPLAFGGALLMAARADAAIKHQYTFNGATVQDLVGTANGTLMNGATVTGGALTLTGGANGMAAPHAALAADTIALYDYSEVSISFWATNTSATNTLWQRYFDFGYQNPAGNSGVGYLFATPDTAGGNNLRFALNSGGEQDVTTNLPINPVGQRHHVLFTFNSDTNVARLYQDGVLVDQDTNWTHSLAALDFVPAMVGDPDRPNFAMLGASLWGGDPGYTGNITQFEIYDHAMPVSEVISTYSAGPVGEAAPPPSPGISELTIDRDSGAMTLSRHGLPAQVVGYSIVSNAGGLNSAAWLSIAENYDANSGGSVDGNDVWTELSNAASKTDFSEFSFDPNGNGATFGATPITLGGNGAWQPSIYEDVAMTLVLADGSQVGAAITFVGNDGSPFLRSDLNFDGAITTADWSIFLSNTSADLDGLTDSEAYAFGDLNGDGAINVTDFRLFKADFLADNEGAGASLFAGANVPEPTTAMLFGTAIAGIGLLRRRRRDANRPATRSARVSPRRRVTGFARLLPLALVAVAMMQTDASAALKHRYSFSTDGMAEDSVGNAHGTLMNGATVAGGLLTLPDDANLGVAAPHVSLIADGANGINIATYNELTIEMWVEHDSNEDDVDLWSRYFDIGSRNIDAGPVQGGNGGNTLFFAKKAAGAEQRLAISNVNLSTVPSQSGFNNEQSVSVGDGNVQPVNTEYHLVGTFNEATNTMRIYINGGLVVQNTNVTHTMSVLQDDGALPGLPDLALIGASIYGGDPGFAGSFRDFRIYDHAFTESDIGKNAILGPDRAGEILKLVVNTITGNVRIENEQSDITLPIDYYNISSDMGALAPGGWMSLDDGEGGDPVGDGWDEGAASVNVLQEFYLGADGEMFAGGGMENLGSAFNTAVFGVGMPGDLTFEYGGPSGLRIQGLVEYVGDTNPVPGDYNQDGVVNAADYTVYRNTKAGLIPGPLPNEVVTIGTTTIEDYTEWKARYGNTMGSGSSVDGGNVPEPTTLVSLVIGCLMVLGGFSSRRRRVL